MIRMQAIKTIIGRVLTPVTITINPHHDREKSLRLNIPAIALLFPAALCCCGMAYLAFVTIDAVKYQVMEKQLRDYSRKVSDLNITLASVKKAEKELYRLLSLGSRAKVLENVDPADIGTADMGTVDIQQVQEQIALSVKTVGAIREYLYFQKDIYKAMPMGLPVPGMVSSPYGARVNPISGRVEVHRGVDISISEGTPVQATAAGVVSFSGWNGGGGNVVVVEHGHGYSTFYAHNQKNAVQVGQRVQRGGIIAYAGATGHATGSHVHYEIWQKGRVLNPKEFIQGR